MLSTLLFPDRRLLIFAALAACSCLITLASMPAVTLAAQEARIQDGQRELAAAMLHDVHQDIKKDYYDPKYHGVDIEGRYKQANDLIKKATSFNQALGVVAWYLEPLNDSHTFFVPPMRAFHLDYGWLMQMVGEDCLVTAVKPGTDAQRQGLTPGDRILMIGSIPPTRDNLGKLTYLLNVLRPQPAIHVVIQRGNEQRSLNIQAEIVNTQQVITWDNYWKETIDYERRLRIYDRHSHALGKDILICKLPAYNMDDYGVDAMMNQAAGYGTLILDLRGNGGGYIDALDRMVGSVFDRDITIGSLQTRTRPDQMVGRSRGAKKAFSGKLFVLIDSKSASAAELFARVMQLEKRGMVLGDRSAGAVMESEQRNHQLGLDRAIAYGDSLTVANIIMSDGNSLEHTGVTPDEFLLPTPEDLAAGHDPVLARAVSLAGGNLSAEEAGRLFPVSWAKF
jgi:C-terminal processing protease CtpA/Prc